MEPHDDDHDPCDECQRVEVLGQHLSDGACGCAERNEDRGEAQNEHYGGYQNPVRHNGRNIVARQFGDTYSRQIGEI